jgi:hypothetical protein
MTIHLGRNPRNGGSPHFHYILIHKNVIRTRKKEKSSSSRRCPECVWCVHASAEWDFGGWKDKSWTKAFVF